MSMLPPTKKTQVSIEDLLRLKASERPTPDFWSQFERELRQKQLTALVRKRRWWHEMPALLNRRVYVPVGAAAALAFTLVTVRHSMSSQLVTVENTAPAIVAADPAVEVLPVTVVSVTGRSGFRQEDVSVPVRPARRDLAPAVLVAASTSTPDSMAPALAAANGNDLESPSARSIAANLARFEQTEPEMVNAVMGSRLSAARVVPASADLAAVDEGLDSTKRYRLIARYADHTLSPEPVAPVLVRERIARRLGDDITERISRVGVEGSRVSLKF